MSKKNNNIKPGYYTLEEAAKEMGMGQHDFRNFYFINNVDNLVENARIYFKKEVIIKLKQDNYATNRQM